VKSLGFKGSDKLDLTTGNRRAVAYGSVIATSGVIGKSTKFGFEWKWPLMGNK